MQVLVWVGGFAFRAWLVYLLRACFLGFVQNEIIPRSPKHVGIWDYSSDCNKVSS